MNIYSMIKYLKKLTALLALCISMQALANPANTTEQTWTSKKTAVSLLELYTSEGCSSCPPAEKWVNQLKTHPKLFTDFIPVVFHVDYWNYLGWSDRFASDAYSHRQRKLQQKGIFSGVYTPGVLVTSKEWNGWRRHNAIPISSHKAGILIATLKANHITVAFEHNDKYTLNMAYLGMGLVSNVTAGENNRKTLNHEFVVLKHWQQEGNGQWHMALPAVPNKQQKSNALVIWLTAHQSENIIQAVAGYLL